MARSPTLSTAKKKPAAARETGLEHRLRIDGEGPNPVGDEDALRIRLARRLHMILNDWRGCPERQCRRQRDCMAPNNKCSNAPSPEVEDERWRKVQAELVAALNKMEAEGSYEV